MFTEDEMNALMDRSDLTYTEKKPEIKEEMMKMEGVFKRVDQPSEWSNNDHVFIYYENCFQKF